MRSNPDPGVLSLAFGRCSYVTHWRTQVAIVQREEISSPIRGKFLCWIEGQQSLTCIPVLACQSFNSTTVLNGGSVYGPYDINRIPLTSDPMPVALLSDPMIRLPLS